MGEILRAVLDQSCTFSNPNFYTIESPPAAGAGAVVNLTSYLQAKQDRHFLVTGIGTGRTNAALGMYLNDGAKIQVKLLKTGRIIYSNLMPMLAAGQDATNMFTLPEYFLVGPAETMQLNVEVPSSANNFVYLVTLFGIEYGL